MRLHTVGLPHRARQSAPCASCSEDEQAILAQIDTLYPIALRLTSDEQLASLVTERTVLAALRDRIALAGSGKSIKSAMLTMLRSNVLRARADAGC